MQVIYVWPDASWMFKQDHCDYQDHWMGDDFYAMEVPDHYTDEDIEGLLNSKTQL